MTDESSMNDVQEPIAIAPPEVRKMIERSNKRPQSCIEYLCVTTGNLLNT